MAWIWRHLCVHLCASSISLSLIDHMHTCRSYVIVYYKISCVLRTLWLVSYHVYIRLCKHGCDVTACFPVLFYKRNRKWTPCVYITWCKHSREFGRIWKYLRKPSTAVRVHINFEILLTSFLCLHQLAI